MFLRTASDAEVLKAQVGPGKRLAVGGGGYIGLEARSSDPHVHAALPRNTEAFATSASSGRTGQLLKVHI